ncbi:hypothetical protein A7W90_02540 [Clostridium sp. Bc-iso-3]|nr:hypothetical protein A7W90_02540 [Clostridium sp. Bc-iso-3]
MKNKISLLSLKKFFLKIPDILFTSANLNILHSIQLDVNGCLLEKSILNKVDFFGLIERLTNIHTELITDNTEVY